MIIGVAGPIASGKSTFAKALAQRFSLKLIGFGQYVRHVARGKGLDDSNRRILQDLGQSLVEDDARAFVQGVFAHASFQRTDGVVLDGIRHDSVWLEILAFASSHGSIARLVLLDMPEEERRKRLKTRALSLDEIEEQDRHPSEADVRDRLPSRADLRLDVLQPQELLLASVGGSFGLE